jgi:hypothetical protein
LRVAKKARFSVKQAFQQALAFRFRRLKPPHQICEGGESPQLHVLTQAVDQIVLRRIEEHPGLPLYKQS